MRRFVRIFNVTEETRVLDVGGTPFNWSLIPVRPRLVILNQSRVENASDGHTLWVTGDGRLLPFSDQSFDVVFSNSVIEHVGSVAGQRKFAAEIARVGVHYWVQTPNRWFPVEPHLLTPFLHFLPARWQDRLVRKCTVWAMLARPSRDRWQYYIEHYLREVRLLGPVEMGSLFPGSKILKERFLGLTKSLIAAKQ